MGVQVPQAPRCAQHLRVIVKGSGFGSPGSAEIKMQNKWRRRGIDLPNLPSLLDLTSLHGDGVGGTGIGGLDGEFVVGHLGLAY